MPYLLTVSFIWAFSFGLTKGLTSGLDGSFVAATRLGLSSLVFLPFLRLKGTPFRVVAPLVGIGAVQFGLMYLAYNESFKHLQAHEVALFTLTTPIFVTLLDDAFERKIHPRSLIAALLAVGGTAVIVFSGQERIPTLIGLGFVQLSNLAFALGQIGYKRFRSKYTAIRDRDIFALLYLGAFALTLPVALARMDFARFTLTLSQSLTLLYLGVLSSGIGFFLWNVGATRVNAGTLAVMNNAKIPLAVVCSLLIFREIADPIGLSYQLVRLSLSFVLFAAAIWFAKKPQVT